MKIAEEEGVDPETVSGWLRKLGVAIKQGQHFVEQPPLKIPEDLVSLLAKGPIEVARLVGGRIWGVRTSTDGTDQVEKFCRFIQLYREGKGVKEISRELNVHRTSVADWREGKDQPYLVKVALVAVQNPIEEGWKLLPMQLGSGGNEQYNWISVPVRIGGINDLTATLEQVSPTEETYERATHFGIDRKQAKSMRPELFAYLLGVMVGDAGKLGGSQYRFASMNLDLQLTNKEESNQALGEFVCMCANSIGIKMDRKLDKKPSGATLNSAEPSAASRWISSRSPLLAWMFGTCLGLDWNQTTSLNPVSMDWIVDAPYLFRTRFIQGIADSDGSVQGYGITIASVPNSKLIADVLVSLGLNSAHVVWEKGEPLRTYVNAREAARLPIFNEFTHGYRYSKLIMFNVAQTARLMGKP